MATLYQPNETIDQRYRIVAPLGERGIETIYEAEDLRNYKRVALKVVSLQKSTNRNVLELFEQEAKVLSNFNHPAIPKYLDYFYLDTAHHCRFYLVRELVSGDSLADWVKKGGCADENQVKKIARKVLKILKYLHSQTPPIIHQNIKPQNIIRCLDGRVYLVDFGVVQDAYNHTLSEGSTFVGTIGYMPPEQLRRQVTPATDLYALGTTLLFLLTGQSPEELPQHRLKFKFRDRVSVSDSFADWLEKMLEPMFDDRFQSSQDAFKKLINLDKNKTNSQTFFAVKTYKKYKPKLEFKSQPKFLFLSNLIKSQPILLFQDFSNYVLIIASVSAFVCFLWLLFIILLAFIPIVLSLL